MDRTSTPLPEPPARLPPPLPDELVEQVLLRFPPADPASLVRAALVRKEWHRIVSAPRFRRRFREFHRTPPMLGFLCTFGGEDWNASFPDFAHFVPTTSWFRPPRAAMRDRRIMDARHGRVLLHCVDMSKGPLSRALAIWDVVTDEVRELPLLTECLRPLIWSAAVLCSVGDACYHLDCHRHRGPFQVVAIGTSGFTQLHAYVYSSESSTWSILASQLQLPRDIFRFVVSSALVENALYFTFDSDANLLKFDLATLEMSMIRPPLHFSDRHIVLTTTEGGQLGFAVAEEYKLYLWSRGARSEGDSGWTQSRVIELEKLLPAHALLTPPDVVASADGTGVFLLLTNDSLYTIDVKTRQVKKVCNCKVVSSRGIFPYMSFYSPDLGATFACEGSAAPSA